MTPPFASIAWGIRTLVRGCWDDLNLARYVAQEHEVSEGLQKVSSLSMQQSAAALQVSSGHWPLT